MKTSTAQSPTRKALAVAAAVGVATVGTVLATAGPAQAAAWYCPSNIACFWSNGDAGGAVWTIDTSQGCKNMTTAWNDVASSVRNNANHGYLLRFWVNGNCSGKSYSIRPNQQGNLGNGGGTRYEFPNDAVSSYAVYPPGTWG
ncbi:hypothetical protein DDE19_29020 [Micromonospora ureilytica]|uniref:Peptidase inhibitor n=1 Tax=Micromonospora ureilytica TaxID=709868 RepID=A0A3N9XGD2_9ACTN|nr:peptidase inhibitor family I36 protein [Micromonospora ureilytica]RQX12214.1 hypothetical protein DDE19_29020 [Micromonospora ureilytica]